MDLPTQEQFDAVDAKARVDESVVRAAMSRVPPSWQLLYPLPSGGVFLRGSLQAMYTVQKYEDGRVWIHVSVCVRKGRSTFCCPSWEDMKRLKHDFIGEDRWAYQVFPSSKDYINHNPAVLHLYALMDGTPALPDFTWGLGSI